jgi:hypothetical protein
MDSNYYTIKEASEKTCWSPEAIRLREKSGEIPGATKRGDVWWIPRLWVEENAVPEGYITTSEYIEKRGISRQRLHEIISAGRLPVIKRGPRKWYVPEI